MANCPNCGKSQKWLNVIRLDRTKVAICPKCGSSLVLDSQRSSILMGGFIAYMAIPEAGFLPFQFNSLWFLFVVATYAPLIIWKTKLNILDGLDAANNVIAEKDFIKYKKKRDNLSRVGLAMILLGLLLMFSGVAIRNNHYSELIMVVGVCGIALGSLISLITKCPFCSKLTVSNLRNKEDLKCIHCNKEIG